MTSLDIRVGSVGRDAAIPARSVGRSVGAREWASGCCASLPLSLLSQTGLTELRRRGGVAAMQKARRLDICLVPGWDEVDEPVQGNPDGDGGVPQVGPQVDRVALTHAGQG